MGVRAAPIADRLERWSIPEPNSGCTLWLGAACKHGYGRIQVPGRGPKLAHRIAYEVKNGPIPEGLKLLHKCDNPGCINPDHLQPGTQAENVADMMAKGRENRDPRPYHQGTKNPNSYITEDLVRNVLLSDLPQKAAAYHFGIAGSWVQRIRAREVWKHIDFPVDQIARPARKLIGAAQ
jgi:hypothetical protein